MQYYLYTRDNHSEAIANHISDISGITRTQIAPQTDLYLELHNNKLYINTKQIGIIEADSIYTDYMKRLKNYKNELLSKVIKVKDNSFQPLIFDLTAGFGKDSFLMASTGAKVVMIEQNQVLVAIIKYFMYKNYGIIDWLDNITILHNDSLKFLHEYTGQIPDFIYLDPMFDHKKSALSKKHMQLIQFLNSQHNVIDANHELFNTACITGAKKIIVKRDNKQKSLIDNPKASYTIKANTVRYDIYVLPTNKM